MNVIEALLKLEVLLGRSGTRRQRRRIKKTEDREFRTLDI